MFSLICAWINGWVNNGEAGVLRRHPAHCDVTVMCPNKYTKYEWISPTPCPRHHPWLLIYYSTYWPLTKPRNVPPFSAFTIFLFRLPASVLSTWSWYTKQKYCKYIDVLFTCISADVYIVGRDTGKQNISEVLRIHGRVIAQRFSSYP